MPDPRARALGLTPGLALADARARVPELAVFESDPAADQAWLERIADSCERYSPSVAADPPDGITIDITGCAHLFHGEAGLAGDLERRMARFTRHLRHAFADSPEGAQALARFGTLILPGTGRCPEGAEGPNALPRSLGTRDRAFDPSVSATRCHLPVPGRNDAEQAPLLRLPVAALRLDAETELALRRAGLKTIGDLALRPSAPIAARFGEAATTTLARLLGHADSRITPRRAAPALFFERRFAEPIARTEDALGTIGALGEEAARALEQRRMGGRRFAARLFRSDGAVRDLAIATGQPTRDPALLLRLFGERVETLADPLDPGFGFDMIRLSVPAIEPLAPAQLELEGGAIGEEAMAALVDRLSTRLGRGCLRRFAPRDTHIPEQTVLALPAAGPRRTGGWPEPRPGEPPLRPIHLFDPPQPIEVIAEVPDGPPHRFRWRRAQHDVVRFEGPERVAAEWWRHAEGLTRDYYRVEDARGRRFWVFRHGLYGSEKPDPRWYIHGLFA
ncbi:MAG: DNA polymerase Y family protein [Novosphingobium sp.]